MKNADNLIILDGGMGGELIRRGVIESTGLWSAAALLNAPEEVARIHRDYIDAGSRVITTNTYSTIPSYLNKDDADHDYVELAHVAGKLARDVADESPNQVQVAGSLPPLDESYRPDLAPDPAAAAPIYQNLAKALAPYVDVFLCETMACIAESQSAALAAHTVAPGKPIWMAWTLHETPGSGLRSGESIEAALAALSDVPIDAYLFNCTTPESIVPALVELRALTDKPIGAYPNRFRVPQGWTLDNEVSVAGHEDLDLAEFVACSTEFVAAGANILGGCCGIGPEYIHALAAGIGR